MNDNWRRARRSAGSWDQAYVLLVCAVTTFAAMTTSVAFATENGACVYPVGVETVLPALTPGHGGTMLYEYSAFYAANEIVNSGGAALPVEFKLRVVANALRIVHNWNLHVLGGTVNSAIAVPLVYEDLHIIPGKFGKFSISNVDVGVFQIAYVHKDLHWYFGGDVWLPGAAYSPNDILNVGQHNFATAPAGAITYLPKRGTWEASSKFLYIVNFNDVTTRYRGGNEFTWEYAGMREINHKIAVGANGFVYRQTTNDMQNGVIVGDGNRGRDIAIGPEVRFHLGAHGGFALKYLPDTLVQNKPRGNAFWFQLGIPVHAGE